MLITKTATIKWRKDNKDWYTNKGYIFTKISDEFEVKVEDLPSGSHKSIECLCDYCLEEGKNTIINTNYYRYNKTNTNAIIHKDSCNKCKGKKIKESNLIVYNTDSVNKLQQNRENVSNRRRAKKEEIERLCLERNFKLVEIYQDNSGRTRIKYICLSHEYIGVQETNYSTLKTSKGCRQCNVEETCNKTRLNGQFVFDEFIRHGYKPLFEPKDYKNAFLYLPYICPNHEDKGVLKIIYNSLQRGSGCPYCAESKGEKIIHEFLKENRIYNDSEYIYDDLLSDMGNPLRFDFCIFEDKEKAKTKCLIEYDGVQHFKVIKGFQTLKDLKKQQYHDSLKDEYCLMNKIPLLRIPYWEFDNIKAILTDYLINNIQPQIPPKQKTK